MDLIGKETSIQGTLKTGMLTRIDGLVEGTVHGQDAEHSTIIVGRDGRIRGDIVAGHIVVNGEVHGNLKATRKISIRHQGVMYGTMHAPCIIVERGAFVFGEFQMKIPQDNPLHGFPRLLIQPT